MDDLTEVQFVLICSLNILLIYPNERSRNVTNNVFTFKFDYIIIVKAH